MTNRPPIKLLLIAGTRPEAIKLAPLVIAGRKRSDQFKLDFCLTGQHRTMLHQVVELFRTEPDVDLDIMAPGQDLFDVTNRALAGLKTVLQDRRPDFVIVQGDTTTAFAGGLAAFYQRIPVVHVEAGLRTGNLQDPWPEEANRKLLGTLADLHFAPTELCRRNLLAEGVAEGRITVTGNTVIDALQLMLGQLEREDDLRECQIQAIEEAGYPLRRDLEARRRIILVTGHRRESFGHGFQEICRGLKALAENNEDVSIVYPVHLNPQVQEPVRDLLGQVGNIHLISPLPYLPFIWLMKSAHFILTDSGGIQEEAPGLGKPVLVMRNTTERPEGIEAGTSMLVGTEAANILKMGQELLDSPDRYRAMAQAVNPFGDGRACERCLDRIAERHLAQG